jgi:3-oxoacyl-[acyl-carrier protein] reductase
VARQIEAENPGSSLVLQGDVSRAGDAERLVARAMEAFGGVDILVNNAGIAGGLAFRDIGRDDWQAMIDTNLTGAFLCAKAVIPHMVKRKRGRIINISSTSGLTGGTSGAHYAAAKGSLIALTKALSSEFAPKGITVNCIAPGKIKTDLLWISLGEQPKEELTRTIPVGRSGTPQEIASLALFLASDQAGCITGETIVASGRYRSDRRRD